MKVAREKWSVNALLGRDIALVIGAAELGSAVAVRLHESGYAVVLCDEVDPLGIRRGMSFVDAWYIGTASVENVRATFCGSIRSIPTVLANPRTIAATTWSWRGVAGQLAPSLVVDARQETNAALHLRAVADGALTVGIGSTHVAGRSADVTVALPPHGTAEPELSVVHATTGGRFHTARHIGDTVSAGDAIGGVGAKAIVAPVAGVLRGLAARGSHVAGGAIVVEIDRRNDPVRCFLICESCDSAARAVLAHVRGAPALPVASSAATRVVAQPVPIA